ncbi:hypothetical protein J1N35_022023, partial [Gossypium stocksii]
KMIDTLEMLQQQLRMIEKYQLRLANDLGRAQEDVAIFWGYVRHYGDEDYRKRGRRGKIEFMHIESYKDDADMTQTTTPIDTTTTPNSIALMKEQERVVHQLIYDLTKSNTDDDDEVPINQLKRRRYRQAARKSVQANADEMERQLHYKHATRKSTQPN